MPPRVYPDKICKHCGTSFNRRMYGAEIEPWKNYRKRPFCRAQCYWDYNTGKRHYKYVPGGVLVESTGYMRTTEPEKGRRRAHLHRIKMEKKLKRQLKPSEHVHHKDGDRLNNKLDNLVLLSASKHAKLHIKKRKRKKNGHFC